MAPATPARSAWRNVWLFAAASFVSDVSGEMLQAVLPFLLVAQAANGLAIGLVGGASEAVGHLFKLVGGYWGDRTRSQKTVVAGGYALAGVSRFGVALAATWPASLAFRSLDRVGKGLRTAPRDAMLADGVPKAQRGRAFGLHRAADTAGAVLGTGIALAAFLLYRPVDAAAQGSLERTIVLWGAGIGVLSAVPILFVRIASRGATDPADPLEPLSPRYGGFLAVSALFYLGHVSYLFFILRAADVAHGSLGAAVAGVVWYLAFNVIYMAASYPAGLLTDRFGRIRILAAGYALSAVAFALFILAPSPWTLTGALVTLGFSFAATEGTGRALAADLAGTAGRSHRMGWFHFTTGLATLAGGIAAGLLWDRFGHAAAFIWGTALSVAALAALVLWAPLREPARREPARPADLVERSA